MKDKMIEELNLLEMIEELNLLVEGIEKGDIEIFDFFSEWYFGQF